ncbi:hypothetical protein [Pontixanthobacter aquaemixtae]|uniref:Uncharacterized protein n=1 Tax=Pontixanthobacter aquaemixtae TaxID=1958940 RepID=A0A844ZX38_9SPHN|nr:hypothetical protein [Pontixanthobacter aquaemixtae]MXO91516.1 hypothetical protein [Pontixanthobacter aquaemixtae]
MTTALEQRIEAGLSAEIHPSVAAFAERLAIRAGAQSALFYGSNLRTGELEGVLDFYLLMPGAQKERIWPCVSYHEWEHEGVVLRAKVATMSTDLFQKAAGGIFRDTTIWTRFVQPSALVWCRDDDARRAVVDGLEAAAITAARFAAALGPDSGTEEEFWRALFQETYKAEFRVEKAGREDSILSLNRRHFEGLLPLAWSAGRIDFDQQGAQLSTQWPAGQKEEILRAWRRKRFWGKPLNLLRLVKASATFEGAARYAAWKVERHTGVKVEVTPWREKHPVLAAPGVLFKVWRSRRGP